MDSSFLQASCGRVAVWSKQGGGDFGAGCLGGQAWAVWGCQGGSEEPWRGKESSSGRLFAGGLSRKRAGPPTVMASGVFPASCVEARISHPECGSAGMSLVEMRSYWERVSPKPNKTGVLRRRGET